VYNLNSNLLTICNIRESLQFYEKFAIYATRQFLLRLRVKDLCKSKVQPERDGKT
jgi:hypothetical protein